MRYIKDDAHGFGVWVWGEGDDSRDARPAHTPTEPSTPAVAAWPVADRDRAYRAMGGKLALGHRIEKVILTQVADPSPDLGPLVWEVIDLADSPKALVDGIAGLLNGLIDPHHLLATLLDSASSQRSV